MRGQGAGSRQQAVGGRRNTSTQKTSVPAARSLLPAASVLTIGVDDTDSPRGLCTTYIATELVSEFSELDLIGWPRLVRLNPNIPWKTRGNGAIALGFGKGAGRPFPVGHLEGHKVLAYPRSIPCRIDLEEVLGRADRTVLANSAPGEERTNPAIFAGLDTLPEMLYKNAVRELVRPSVVLALLDGARRRGRRWAWKVHRGPRGIVGATAAAAWRGRRRTFEWLAYRMRERWGTPRRLDPGSVRRMDQRFLTTFNNIDLRNRHIVIAPHSPCPVLFGIRAFSPDELGRAAAAIKAGEGSDRALMFLSNQGTDDHLQPMRVSVVRSYCSPVIAGRVESPPRTGRGGHVFFSITDRTGTLDCAAFEPTKEFRALVRQLLPGDRVVASGGVHRRPFTLNLEKLELVRAVPAVTLRKPRCPACGTTMKSAGRAAGYRCRRCHRRSGAGSAVKEARTRTLSPGVYEVPKCARRHLSRPLER